MTTHAFSPKFMKVGILTAALQELTPRQVRDADPDRAIEDWLAFGKELGADYLQLSAALHPSETDVPPEAMLDPVANTLDLRQPFDKARASRVQAAVTATGTRISDLAYFDNLLHHDAATRKKKHDFAMRVFDAAALLGVDAVCGFVGRNQQHSMDENLVDFEQQFVPLLKEAKSRGPDLSRRAVSDARLDHRRQLAQQHRLHPRAHGSRCTDLREARRRRSVPHSLRPVARHPDGPGHAIDLQFLKDSGYGFLIGGFHVKGQVVDSKGVSAWGYGGQTMERGDWVGGKPSANPADHVNAWKKQVVLCEHELPGTARHDPLAYLQNRTVDWLDHQLAARELLPLDVANTYLIVEHEYPAARIQDRERLKPVLQGSLAFVRHIDQAAAAMFALQHEVLAAQGIPIQGVGREAFRS
jgi:hypothetical protein